MIFSSQLGKINTASPQEGIAQVANHIRKMQEELEYRLMNLSSDNISEIDAKQTTILLSDGQQLGDAMLGNYAKLEASVNGLRSEVASLNGRFNSYSTISQTADAITAAVVDLKSGLGTKVTLEADGLYVEDADGDMVKVQGGWIDAEGLSASYIIGSTIDICYDEDIVAGYIETDRYSNIEITGNHDVKISSSYALELTGDGAGIRITDDVFVNGGLYPDEDGAWYLGNKNYTWAAVWSESCEIDTSDRNKKNSIEDLPEKYIALFDALTPCRFKLNKGTSDRYHVGFISQEVEEAMAAAGIDSQEFGGFVKDVNEKGEDVYALRYSEFIGILTAKIQQMQREIDKLKARVA